MTVTAAAVRLPRFAGKSAPETAHSGFRRLNEKPAPPPAGEDRAAVTAAAVAAALATAAAEFESVRAADRAAFERRLAERESEILAVIGEKLSGQVVAELAAIAERVGAHVGTGLRRFLDNAVRERAVRELVETVSALLVGASATRVTVAGPAALTERVAAAVAAAGVPVERADGEVADVSVTIDDTIVETNIAAWMDRLMAEIGTADHG